MGGQECVFEDWGLRISEKAITDLGVDNDDFYIIGVECCQILIID